MRVIHVLIIEDHPIVVAGFRALMLAEPDIQVVQASTAAEGLELGSRDPLDVFVVDVDLPDASGFDVTRQILQRDRSANVLMFTMCDAPIIAAKAVEVGARGVFSKTDNPARMVNAIRTVARGEVWLPEEVAQTLALVNTGQTTLLSISVRELDVLRLLAKGRSLSEIADATAVSYKTITNDCTALRSKLNARTMMELVRIAIEQRLI